jgi:hypothetical protein
MIVSKIEVPCQASMKAVREGFYGLEPCLIVEQRTMNVDQWTGWQGLHSDMGQVERENGVMSQRPGITRAMRLPAM